MALYPAQSKRGLLAQIRELGEAALRGDTDQAERLVAVIIESVDGLVPDDDDAQWLTWTGQTFGRSPQPTQAPA